MLSDEETSQLEAAHSYRSSLEEEIRLLFSQLLSFGPSLPHTEWYRLHTHLQNRLRDHLNLLKERRDAARLDPSGVICLL